jgi:gliding motility-associated-like protein
LIFGRFIVCFVVALQTSEIGAGMRIKKHYFFLLLILLTACFQQAIYAQCTTPISSFPYNEDFEATDGNWTTGGVLSDWAWGQPAKPVINAAGGGSKCWIIGGTTGSSYNGGEKSWLQSPCFDISSLTNPQVSFKVFWETERRYDGAGFEYSLDGGMNWFVLGSINSNSNCTGENWFNFDPVNFLGGPGWSGNIQPTSGSCQGTGGSGGWLTAKHTLSTVAGATGIIFRFTFAAGTTCNGYDGFAIDDIQVGEAAPNAVDFTYTCNANNTVDFSSSISGCKTSVNWDFGDPASGANNSSTLDNPAHAFSSPGNYTVSVDVSFVSGPSLIVAKTINVIAVTGAITNPIKCNGYQTGAISVTVSPAGTYNYTWNTNPPRTTPSINNLAAGTYTVTVTGTNTCSASLPVTINEPERLWASSRATHAICGSNNGTMTAEVTGGTPPFNYLWSTGAVIQFIYDLAPGLYSYWVTDANGCGASQLNLPINNVTNTIDVFLGKDTTICAGQSLLLNPGNFVSYQWQDNSTASTYTVTSTGIYSVSVTDVLGCTGTGSIQVIVECSEIFFPSGFTPDGDGNNETFGPLPLSALSSLRDYKLTVYGRWGEVIFTSTDPFLKWDGTYKGKILPTQTFTWIATYTQRNLLPQFQKGTISIFR